jgi:hypothetical protein
MPDSTLNLCRALLPGLLLCTALQGAAQEGRWYRVELLVVGHNSGDLAESWDPLPQLAYPDASRFLLEPGAAKQRLHEHDANGETDAYGRQTLTRNSDGGGASSPNAAAVTSPGNPDTAGGPATQAAQDIYPRLPTPFVTLPASQLEFRGKASYMQRTAQYRTLFHEAWVQPMRSESDTLSIILDRSGDTGDWPELQGSVKLYLSRYLHLETNLWLNTQGSYFNNEWRMPAPPLGPPSVIIEQPAAPEPVPPVNEVTVIMSDGTPVTGALSDEPGAGPDAVDPAPVYPFRHAVLMQQKRRMRSGEIHYLDHPMFGVIVKITPMEAEELDQMGRAEAGPIAAGNMVIDAS